MCVKYTTFKTQKQLTTIILDNSVTNVAGYGCKGSQEAICMVATDVELEMMKFDNV